MELKTIEAFMAYADAKASRSQFQYVLTQQAKLDRKPAQPRKRKSTTTINNKVPRKRQQTSQNQQNNNELADDEYRVKIQQQQQQQFIAPSYFNYCYTLKPVTAENTLTLHISEFAKMQDATDYEVNNYLCLQHGLTTQPINEHCCIQFDKFPFSFVIETANGNFAIFPPPERYVSKNFNYFRYLLREMAKKKDVTDSWSKVQCNLSEERAYNEFIKNEFKGGQIQSIISGKKSYIRNRILGFHTFGLRHTLTIDSLLTAHYISIPAYVYKTLDLLTPLVLVNRAPSINDGCLYVCELLCHSDDDPTIHLNPFLTERLHADQEGDD
jgi:hypothetical protein